MKDNQIVQSKKARLLMAVSGILGLLFFIIANFTQVFQGLNLIAAGIQVCINGFVFYSWMHGFNQSRGAAKAFCSLGMIIPICMATITIVRVIIPALL